MEFRKYLKIYSIGHEENQNLLKNPEEEIVIEEKVDGANFRFYINQFGEVIFGSHSQQLSESKEHKYAKNFARCIEYLKEKLYQRDLEKYKGMIFYGECCVPHSMNYDWEKIPPFLGFDINNDENENYPKRYIPYPLVEEIYKELGLEFVPVVKVCKVKEIVKIDDELVPVSKYAIASGTEDTRKSEGIVLKKYSFIEGSKDEGDEQIFGKYVRDKFKETNALVFGDKRVKYNSE
ncbi:MAG: RNA ligase family protein, partial [Candidatus Paceibacterota bacterium]